jgi:hypothetical protein
VVAKITLLIPASHGESDDMQTAPESRDWGRVQSLGQHDNGESEC